MILLSAAPCDAWTNHLGLLLAVFVLGCWCGMVVLSIQRFASEESRAERRREREAELEREQRRPPHQPKPSGRRT